MDHELNLILDSYKEMYLTEEENKIDEGDNDSPDNTTSYGCLMVYFDSEIRKRVEQFCEQHITDEHLSDDGIDDEAHVTVMYGFHPDITPEHITNFINYTVRGSVDVRLKKVSRFEGEKYDVLKVDVDSPDLHELNSIVREEFDGKVEITFPNYHPHMTIAYLKKGALPHLDGDDTFDGYEFSFDDFVFSTAGMDDNYLISKDLEVFIESEEQMFIQYEKEDFWPLVGDYIREGLDDIVEGKTEQSWVVLPVERVARVWKLYGERGIIRDMKGLTMIAERIFQNAAKMQANNILTGHEQYGVDEEDLEDFGFETNDDMWKRGNEYLWSLPISDYGLPKIFKLIEEMLENSTNPEHVLLSCDKIFNVIHMRDDLSSHFIKGGSKSLDLICDQ